MIIRKHLLCDSRQKCSTCSVYTWPPDMEKPLKYYKCEMCNLDYLCELGLAISYTYSADGLMHKELRCAKCHKPVISAIWPEEKANEK